MVIASIHACIYVASYMHEPIQVYLYIARYIHVATTIKFLAIYSYLSFFDSVPVWINTVQVLYFGWKVVSVLAPLLDGTAPADHLRDLLTKFGAIGTTVKSIYDVSFS